MLEIPCSRLCLPTCLSLASSWCPPHSISPLSCSLVWHSCCNNHVRKVEVKHTVYEGHTLLRKKRMWLQYNNRTVHFFYMYSLTEGYFSSAYYTSSGVSRHSQDTIFHTRRLTSQLNMSFNMTGQQHLLCQAGKIARITTVSSYRDAEHQVNMRAGKNSTVGFPHFHDFPEFHYNNQLTTT